MHTLFKVWSGDQLTWALGGNAPPWGLLHFNQIPSQVQRNQLTPPPQSPWQGARSSWHCSHHHSQGTTPPHAHCEALNEGDLGEPQSKEEGQRPPTCPAAGPREIRAPFLPPLPPAKGALLLHQPLPLPRAPPSKLHVALASPTLLSGRPQAPRPPARPKALKERKADSLGCPLKPPRHFHQPPLPLARRLHSRSHFLLPSRHTWPSRLQAPPRPAVIGRSCLENKFSGSQPSAGSGTNRWGG